MAVKHRTSLGITQQEVDRATAEQLPDAKDTHLANIAETLATMWLDHYGKGKCSLRDALVAFSDIADAAGPKGDSVLAQFVRDVLSAPKPVRKRGGKSHPDGLRFYGWSLADFFAAQGYAIQRRDADKGVPQELDEKEAPAFVMAAGEMRRLGLGDFSPAAVRGMWEGERARWVKRARKGGIA